MDLKKRVATFFLPTRMREERWQRILDFAPTRPIDTPTLERDVDSRRMSRPVCVCVGDKLMAAAFFFHPLASSHSCPSVFLFFAAPTDSVHLRLRAWDALLKTEKKENLVTRACHLPTSASSLSLEVGCA